MTSNIFRPVEFWESAIMTMPDNSFFELMRNVFGKIKTPFNKQQLINDLETFLLREDIQEIITAYIDENDTKIITAVAVLGEPSPAYLGTFFEGELNYVQLQDIIVNLEERFILYRFYDQNSYFKGITHPKRNISRISLNPVLEPVLLPFTTDISLLFPKTPVKIDSARSSGVLKEAPAPETRIHNEASGAAGTIINDRILAGLFSFVSRNEPFYKSEGVIRKRIIETGKTHFPGIDLSLLFGSLQILGLFYIDTDNLVPDKKRFDDFGLLSARERSEYCAAALLVYSELDSPHEILPPLYKPRIREITNFIHRFLDSLEADFLYHEQFLKRLTEILKQKTDTTISGDKLLDVLDKTGLLVTEPNQYRHAVIARNKPDIINENPFITVDSDSSILVYPEIDFTDALSLAAISNIQEAHILKDTHTLKGARTLKGAGEVVRFEIDKDSVVKAFDNNISADKIIDLLKRLSCNRIDEALIWNIKDWEKRYSEVSLKKGVILTLSEDRRYLIETMPLADLISENLAPGVYLLPENTMDKTAAALQTAGIDIIARCSEKPSANVPAGKYFLPLPSGCTPSSLNEKISFPVNGLAKSSKHETEDAATLTKNFYDILKKLPIDETGRAELSARIDRHLILCETQLKEANVRYEKLEARHMDYAGKQNIAKQAIAQQSPVEVIWRGEGKEKNLLGIPKALEKEEAHIKGSAHPKRSGELVLVINPADSHIQNEDKLVRIPLAKISLLRRLKKSIFEI